MSGSEPRYVDHFDTVIEDCFDFHSIVRCQYKVEKDDVDYVDGYSIVLKADSVVQARVPSFSGAVASILQGEQTLHMLKAYKEQQASDASTDGLMTDDVATDEDVIN